MKSQKRGITLDQSIEYKIELQGRLDERWSHWFDDMNISIVEQEAGATITVLSGLVNDQAALHGLLNRVRDLGITLLSVQLVNGD